ncbi:AMP-binding enzyme [Streptomyces asiaticus]
MPRPRTAGSITPAMSRPFDERGYITFVGRTDDVFKASDYKISPFEVESVLVEHPAVLEAAVVPAPDSVRLAVPKAYIALAPGQEASDDTALSILRYAREPELIEAGVVGHGLPESQADSTFLIGLIKAMCRVWRSSATTPASPAADCWRLLPWPGSPEGSRRSPSSTRSSTATHSGRRSSWPSVRLSVSSTAYALPPSSSAPAGTARPGNPPVHPGWWPSPSPLPRPSG